MEVMDLGVGHHLVPYVEAWDLQRELHAGVVDGSRDDALVLVEHESVYTAGKRTASWDRPTDGTPVVDVDRGGRITWHGPGQIVAYPILRLAQPMEVVGYVRALEQGLIDLCGHYGLEAVRVEGRSGVWLPADDGLRERKIAAIGVRVARGVTMHGLALNCEPDLAEFGRIVPCGIPDADVTSLAAETGRAVPVTEVLPVLLDHLLPVLEPVRAAARSAA